MPHRLLLVLGLALFALPASAQPVVDSLLTWRGYNRVAEAHVRVYPAPPSADKRPKTIVVRELARNDGPSTVRDVRFLADLVGRQFGIDPVRATWVLHWGAFSFAGAEDVDKELFLRVTFRRTSSGRLSSPYWRVISADDLRELTDRRWSRR